LGETKGNVGAVEVGVIAAVTVVEVKVVSEDFSAETGVMKDGN